MNRLFHNLVRASIIFCILVSIGCNGSDVYEAGDGIIIDNGYFSSYPRFRIELPDQMLAESRKIRFRIKKCPASTYDFHLVVKENGICVGLDRWRNVWDEIRDSGIEIQVVMRGVSISELYSGTLAEEWGTGAISSERFFQASKLNGIKLNGDFDIELILTIDNPELLTKDISLQPVIIGGGRDF